MSNAQSTSQTKIPLSFQYNPLPPPSMTRPPLAQIPPPSLNGTHQTLVMHFLVSSLGPDAITNNVFLSSVCHLRCDCWNAWPTYV